MPGATDRRSRLLGPPHHGAHPSSPARPPAWARSRLRSADWPDRHRYLLSMRGCRPKSRLNQFGMVPD